MRHAKSSWANPGARDYDRELNDRGVKDLTNIAAALKERAYHPQRILCSPAFRTRQTLEGISGAFKNKPEVVFLESLYSSGVTEYLELIQNQPEVDEIMIVGHNPMCGSLVHYLAGHGNQKLLSSIALKYPTGTVAVLEFDASSWRDISKASGTLTDCILPKQLRH